MMQMDFAMMRTDVIKYSDDANGCDFRKEDAGSLSAGIRGSPWPVLGGLAYRVHDQTLGRIASGAWDGLYEDL